MKNNSLPSRVIRVKPHFSATLRDATFSTSQFSNARLTDSSPHRPLQQCAESAGSQSSSTKGRRDEIGNLQTFIDRAKLDSADRFACAHSPNGERAPRSGNPVVLKPLYDGDVVGVRLRAGLLDGPTKETCRAWNPEQIRAGSQRPQPSSPRERTRGRDQLSAALAPPESRSAGSSARPAFRNDPEP